MATIYEGWANANESRNYPFVDGASRQDASDVPMPEDLVCDINLWMPSTAGSRAFIASAVVSAQLVTITLAAAPINPGDPSTPLAVVSLTKPVVRYRNYPVEAAYPGVGGWVMFGGVIDEQDDISLIFDDPEATEILPRLLRPYDDLPLVAVGKEGVSHTLQGVVGLRAGNNLEVIAATETPDGDPDYLLRPSEMRKAHGEYVPGMVFRVKADAQDYQKLYSFAGKCAPRPDVQACPRTTIRKINGVSPDCNGNLTIEFEGGIPNGVLSDDGTLSGIVVDYVLGLADVCNRTPGARYREMTDLCYSSESSGSSEPSSISSSSGSSVVVVCPDVAPPYVHTFQDASDLDCWVPTSGTWSLISCGYQGLKAVDIGLSYLRGTTSENQVIRTMIYVPDTGAPEARGGLVFGWENNNRYAFIELDLVNKTLGLRRFNGLSVVTYFEASIPALTYDNWYQLRVDVSASHVVQVYLDNVLIVARSIIMREGRVGYITRDSVVVFNKLAFGIDPGIIGQQCTEYSSSSSDSSSSGGP